VLLVRHFLVSPQIRELCLVGHNAPGVGDRAVGDGGKKPAYLPGTKSWKILRPHVGSPVTAVHEVIARSFDHLAPHLVGLILGVVDV
jgi:hypothetical protein